MTQVEHSEAVVRLFSQHQRWLHGYLTALTGNAADADDVFQEVCVVMWQQHEKFELGTNFVSWLSVIAYRQAQKFWRERKKKQRLLGDDVLQQIAELIPQESELFEARRAALGSCLQKLERKDRELIRIRYADHRITAAQVADETGKPVGAIYKSLHRIRRVLHDCVSRNMVAEGTA